MLKYKSMSVQNENKNTSHYSDVESSNNLNRRVNVNDLVSKMNEDKKKDRKNSLIIGAAAVSAVTVFGIILTL